MNKILESSRDILEDAIKALNITPDTKVSIVGALIPALKKCMKIG